ncbi:MAG: ABC transporter substrate-binding protein [Chloroflexi bacterium]|nr:ABC transporter substrate-binding protein [Chloroflexota bacterium]
MPVRKLTNRRRFLRAAALGAASTAILSACGPSVAPTPTVAPAKPAESKPAAAAPTPTPAPAAKPAAAPTAAPAKPAAAATQAPAKPAATAKPAQPKLGANLIGKLEGPTLITDPAQYPKTFKEAPVLADLVKAGKLPPVEKRLPDEPLVIKPLREIGKYGGTWRRGFTGPADGENMNRVVSSDRLLFSDYTGAKVMPSVAKAWKMSDDGKTFTLSLRKGLKWSNGTPFTADDVMFWFTDLYSHKDLMPVPAPEMSINGKAGTVEKVDDFTVAFKFPEPYFMFEEIMGGDSRVGAGLAAGGSAYGPFMGAYAPAHYLKQFHPKYVSKEELDQKVKAGGFDNWVSLLRFKTNWQLNTELPVLTPWMTTTPINKPTWVLERNPYYWEVDTDGNQLPYIDKVVLTLAENLEVLNLRAAAGEYDVQGRHEDLGKLPILLANQEKGGYRVHLDPADYGCDACVYANQTYEGDPEIAKWLSTADFRRALSLGIDRDQLNETFWLGVGTPGSAVVAENNLYNPGPEYRTRWSTYDPKQASALLDKIGLDKKDAEGYRLRTDGKGRLRLEVADVGAAFLPLTQIAEMVKEHWKKIGIHADVVEQERSLLLSKRIPANEHQLVLHWGNTGTEIPFISTWTVIPNYSDSIVAPLFGKWYATNGASGKKPVDPQLLRAMELFRSAAGLKTEDRIKAGQELWRIHVDQQWTIGTVGLGPAILGVRVAKTNVGNVPDRLSINRNTRTPGASHPATYFFK